MRNLNKTMINDTAQKQIDAIAAKCAEIKPLVIIHSTTYNHEKYLRDALEGFVMQKTDFKFVAIVHEDASTDCTASILREYAEKYPNIILPIFEQENLYSKHDGSIREIMTTVCNKSGAKYIAYCEGDDYWTDSHKLQKQVDFLQTHPDYTMCFNKIEVINEFFHKRYPLANVETREYSGNEIIESMLLQTASVIIRRSVFQSERYEAAKKDIRFRSGDIIIYLSAASMGKIYCIADVMSIYRVNSGGVTNNMRKDPFRFVYEVQLMNIYFGDKFSRSLKNNLAKGYLRTLGIGLKSLNLGITLKSIGGVLKYIWWLKPSSVIRSLDRKRYE